MVVIKFPHLLPAPPPVPMSSVLPHLSPCGVRVMDRSTCVARCLPVKQQFGFWTFLVRKFMQAIRRHVWGGYLWMAVDSMWLLVDVWTCPDVCVCLADVKDRKVSVSCAPPRSLRVTLPCAFLTTMDPSCYLTC